MTMTSMSAQSQQTSDPAALATVIHNDVLQSLGVAVLGVDLCRRFHQQQRYELALEEITGIAEALALALASSERLLPDLDRLVPASRPGLARPSLVVMDNVPGASPSRTDSNGRPAAGPREIVETLTACATLSRRLRSQYDAGLGEDTMCDLEVILQRLEFASVAFREVMGQLRQLAGHSLVPQASPSQPKAVAWSRSA
jgi:hypothetical protein